MVFPLLPGRYLLDEFLNEDLLDFPSTSPRDRSRFESTFDSLLFQPSRQFSVHPHEKDILSEITGKFATDRSAMSEEVKGKGKEGRARTYDRR